jgi:hypothetical protein
MSSADKDILYRVAYDEAVRALSEQQFVIDSFRTRTGVLLSAAAVTTSFLGAQALRVSDLTPAVWMAIAGFGGVALASLAILWPRRWELGARPTEIIDAYIDVEKPATLEVLHRDLALHMYGSYYENQSGLGRLAFFFQIASGLLTAEVILWIIAIASTA